MAAAAAAVFLAATSTGDVMVLAVVLGLSALDASAAATALLSLGAVALRSGSAALPALAGVQHVVGPAGWTGSPLQVMASWTAALALVAAAPAGLAALGFGMAGALVVAGPAAGTLASVALRFVGAALGMAVAVWVARRWPVASSALRRASPLALAGAAVALAVLG